MKVRISEINIMQRIRKDNGDLQELADSIKSRGLINPITLMESNDGYLLLAGFRRLSAIKMLGQESIDAVIKTPLDAEEQLRIEISENEHRKDFTESEKVEYAEKLRIVHAETIRRKMSVHARDGYKNQGCDRGHNPEEDATPQHERTDDELAKLVGFRSGRQLHRATYVAKTRPDLMNQVDSGKKSVTAAYEEARGIDRKAKKRQAMQVAEKLGSFGQIDGHFGHTGEEFTRDNGFDYVIGEINSASAFFLREMGMAAEHYTDDLRSPDHNHEIITLFYNTLHAAADAFGIELKEE